MADGSPGAGRARWVRPVVVAAILAVGMVAAVVVWVALDGRDGGVPAPPLSGPPVPPPTSTPPATAPAPTPAPASATATATGPAVAHTGMGMVFVALASYDLDSSRGTGGDQVSDLFHSGEALLLRGGARAAPLAPDQAPAPQTCRSALADRGTDRIVVGQVRTGLSLCVTTSRQAPGFVSVTRVDTTGQPARLTAVYFTYTIWRS